MCWRGRRKSSSDREFKSMKLRYFRFAVVPMVLAFSFAAEAQQPNTLPKLGMARSSFHMYTLFEDTRQSETTKTWIKKLLGLLSAFCSLLLVFRPRHSNRRSPELPSLALPKSRDF